MKRRTVLEAIGSMGGIGVISNTVAAKPDKNRKKGVYDRYETSKQLRRIGSQIDFHPSQKRAAFISAAFERGIELYVAEGIEAVDDSPSEVYQITSGTTTGVFNPTWESGNRLSFQRNLTRYSMKITPSYKILDHKVEQASVVDIERTMQNATVVSSDG